MIIGVAMVISMLAAGLAGAHSDRTDRLGSGSAQASSIVLTTVTDIVGFLSFLGLASLFAAVL
ncbi:MAG TPA: hypothetical protein VMM79_10275 [Longimicrobiales bacterium]|nr:hypothetical protein [Longimicrobiales bacterium]